MKPINAVELMRVWEHGLNQSMLNRALILLATVSPELAFSGAAILSIGQRDARLMELREWLFGSRLVNTAICPQCSERVEWENDVDDICSEPPVSASSFDTFHLAVEEYRLRFRLPNSMDIAGIMENIIAENRSLTSFETAGGQDSLSHDRGGGKDSAAVGSASMELLNRCIVEAEHYGKRCDIDELPDAVLDALAHRIRELDPLAEVRIALICPECSYRWEALFDIAEFLWAEINAWAERTLWAVHRLASAYGWTEREILSLSPVRRQLYLGMVNS